MALTNAEGEQIKESDREADQHKASAAEQLWTRATPLILETLH